MPSFRLADLLIEYLPDGDDPGVGLLRIELDGQTEEVDCSRDQWDEIWEESAPS